MRPEPAALVDTQVALLLRRFDPEHGGSDPDPELPPVEALTLLLRQWRRSGDPRLAQIVRRGLDALGEGLWDPMSATDQADWIWLFTEAGQRLGEPRYLKLSAEAGAYAQSRFAAASGVVFADATAALAAALFYASAVLGRPEWEACGLTAMKRLMALAPDGRIPHTPSGRAAVHGWLRDQALGLRAALCGYQLSGEPELLEWAMRVAEWALAHLWDPERRAFSDVSPEGRLGDLTRPQAPILPNAEMAEALFDLEALTGQSRFGEVAGALVAGLAREAERSPAGPALALAASRQIEDRIEALVTGESTDPEARELARALVRIAGPTLLIQWEPGAPAAIALCTRNLCLPAIVDSGELSDSLNDLGLLA